MIDIFLQRIGAVRQRQGEFRVPSTDRWALERAAGAAPEILLGDRGYALIFRFVDGIVMLMGIERSAGLFVRPDAYVARSSGSAR